MNLFFDLETIPADETLKAMIVDLERKKEAKKDSDADESEKKQPKSEDDIYRKTALSGDFGRIFCVGYALSKNPVDVITGDEKDILIKFWKIAGEADCFVGHNIYNFDLPYLYKRSIIHKIQPANKHINLSFARYKSNPIFDTMFEWEKWNYKATISLDRLAKALGLESSKDGGIDGSKVYDAYLEKRYEEIYEYCKRDVELTREVYKRMCFIE